MNPLFTSEFQRFPFAVLLLLPIGLLLPGETGWSAETNIQVDGATLGVYHSDLEGTPGIYPLKTPAGVSVTRNYPMIAATADERDDHPHHRSLWFTHGEVNGIDFWGKTPGTGQVRERGVEVRVFDSVTELRTQNDWIGPKGDRVLRDQRKMRFFAEHGDHVIDFSVRLIASDGDVVFGDTKEGSFGIRVAGTMKVDAKLGGQVRNAEDERDKQAWGKVSSWVDYSGPADDQTAGITIIAHPKSDLPETHWHVRTYGLFAANPFGRKHFGLPAYDGHRLKKGETLDLHYRVIVHDGEFDEEKNTKHVEAFTAATPTAF